MGVFIMTINDLFGINVNPGSQSDVSDIVGQVVR